MVVYTGKGGADGIPLTICLGNNSRLGFNNPFNGISSFTTINEESKIKKRNSERKIETDNCGAWLSIPAHKEKDRLLITPV